MSKTNPETKPVEPVEPVELSPMEKSLKEAEAELKKVSATYNVVDARTKQQYKNLIDKIENRQLMPNASFKGVSLTDIMKDAVKEVPIPDVDKAKIKDLRKKINAYKTLMG